MAIGRRRNGAAACAEESRSTSAGFSQRDDHSPHDDKTARRAPSLARQLAGRAVAFLVSVAVVDVVARRITEWNLRAARLRASWQRNPIHLRVLDIFVVSPVASGIGTSHPVPIELRLVLFLSLPVFDRGFEGPDYPMELWTEMKKLDQSEILRLVSFGFLVHTIVRLEVIFASKHNLFPMLSSILVNFGLLRLLGLFCHYVVGNREMFVPWWRRQEGVQWPHVAMASEAASAAGCLLCGEVLCNTTVCLALLPNFALIVLAETADYLHAGPPRKGGRLPHRCAHVRTSCIPRMRRRLQRGEGVLSLLSFCVRTARRSKHGATQTRLSQPTLLPTATLLPTRRRHRPPAQLPPTEAAAPWPSARICFRSFSWLSNSFASAFCSSVRAMQRIAARL